MKVDIDELERLDKEATPGPWKDVLTQAGIRHIEPGEWSKEICALYGGSHDTGDIENSSLIVAIRNALPAIIAELKAGRALRHALGRLEPVAWRAFDVDFACCEYDEAIKGDG